MASSRLPVAAALLALAACSNEPTAIATGSFSVTAMDARGVMHQIAAHRGKPVLVNLWATWCPPCVAEIPDLIAATKGFRARGGVVLSVAMEQLGDVSAEDAVPKATAKAKELGVDFPVFVCTDDEMKTIRAVFGVEIGGLPQTLTYDRAGNLVQQNEGMATREQFETIAKGAER
ncbi:MAG: TlpA family protein disulfide reductase [Planctomycetes bacterium]|nr:TlpA family protein disulfide reductase [Planctomycetota bacterium]